MTPPKQSFLEKHLENQKNSALFLLNNLNKGAAKVLQGPAVALRYAPPYGIPELARQTTEGIANFFGAEVPQETAPGRLFRQGANFLNTPTTKLSDYLMNSSERALNAPDTPLDAEAKTQDPLFRIPESVPLVGGTEGPTPLGLVQNTLQFAPEIALSQSGAAKSFGQLIVNRFGIKNPKIASDVMRMARESFGIFAGGTLKGEPTEAAITAAISPFVDLSIKGIGTVGRDTKNFIKANAPGFKKLMADVLANEHGVIQLGAAGKPTKTFSQEALDVGNYVKQQTTTRELARKAETGGIKKRVGDAFRLFKRKFVDQAAPIEDTLRKSQKQGNFKVLPKADITDAIDRVYRAPTLAGQFIKDRGLAKVIQQVDNIDEFEQVLIARHSPEFVRSIAKREGIKEPFEQTYKKLTGRALAKDQELLKHLGPKYEQQAQIVNRYSQDLLDYVAERGLVSKEAAAQLKKDFPNYVPFNRVFNEIELANQGLKQGRGLTSLSGQSVVQKATGSQRAIESPLESLINKTNDAFVQGERNRAAQILASYRKNLPIFKDIIKEAPPGTPANQKFSALVNGVKKDFAAPPEIVEAAKNLSPQHLGVIGRMFAVPVRVAKTGITALNTAFGATNVVRDQATAFINSQNSLKTSIANPPVFIRSLFSALKHDKLYDDMIRSGGGFTSFDIARDPARATLKGLRSQRNFGSRVKFVAKNPGQLLRMAEDAVSRAEEFTRLQQFTGTRAALLKQGRNLEDATILAAKAARENTANFVRRGEYGQVLNATLLYFNAAIQGSRAYIRAFARDPKGTAAKFATTQLFPLALATAYNLANDERRKVYEDIPDFEKDSHLIIIPPGAELGEDGKYNAIKVPLAPGLNGLTVPFRMALEKAHDVDPQSFQDMVGQLFQTVLPFNPLDASSTASALTPQIIKPSLEVFSNRLFFQDRDIVPDFLQDLPPEQQTFRNTSGSARLIGDLLDVSPLKVEAFIKESFGGLGSQLQNLSDKALSKAKVIPEDQVGGRSVLEDIERRFTRATGNKREFEARERIREKLVQRRSEKRTIKDKAVDSFAQLQTMDKEARLNELQRLKREDEALFAEVKKEIKKAKQGKLNGSDYLLKKLGVEDKTRAEAIVSELRRLPKEERTPYLQGLRQKGILSKKVFGQVKELTNPNQNRNLAER